MQSISNSGDSSGIGKVTQVGEKVHSIGQPSRIGSVKYAGAVEGYSGNWVGVDWDADGEGKHDGSHNGVRYFTARGSNTASFVQPQNLSTGSSLIEALETRYRARSIKEEEGCKGVCIMSTSWKEQQHPSFIHFISSFLETNSFRLNFVQIAPDFIFNCGGLSVAFIFATNWNSSDTESIFSRIQKLKGQFANFYVVVTLPTKDHNDSFVRSYFKHEMGFGKPTFIPVQDIEMGFEKIVKIAHARGVCKKQDAIAKLKDEREKSVQSMEIYIKVVTSIPGIDNHDANALIQAIGSIETIAKASKEYILQTTDLSTEKAETITRFFRDPKCYLAPKIK